MGTNKSSISDALYKKAEDFIKPTTTSFDLKMSDALSFIQELLAHQAALESQIRELEKSESEFSNVREYYKDIFNNQPVGLYRIRVFSVKKWGNRSWENSDNPPYKMEFASDRFCEILGVTQIEFSKNPFIISDLVCTDDIKSFVKRNEEASKKFIPFRWEGRLLVKNKVVWVRLESVPRRLDNGDIIWTGILNDITEHVFTENALKENKLHLEDILIGANIGTLEWNIQTGEMKFNDIWAKNTGFTRAEINFALKILKGKAWKMVTHPDDVAYADEMLKRHFSGELPYHSVEVRMRHKKGHWIWVRQEGKVKTWTPDGKPLLMYGTHTDITNRKKNEEELSNLNNELEVRVAKRTEELQKLNDELILSEQKFKTVTDFTYDWEYWKSPDGKILFMSPSVERITGYSVAEFENNPKLLDKIIYIGDVESWESHKKERCVNDPNEKKLELIFRIVTKKGEIRWMGHVCRCINIDGKHLGVRVSNRDITEKVNAEKELLAVTVEVEERERNRFSRELHDGMGPLLSTIKLYFQWLADTDDIQKKKLITEKGNHNIEMAIQTARELARGLSSQLIVNSGYIRAIQDFAQRINDTNKIKIYFYTNTHDRFNNFLEITLFRITTELIKNTLTYAQATLIEIDFKYNKANNTISLTYTDNGIGFDSETILKTNKGLGLMNIQQRVQILKGNIKITSNPGEGMKTFIEFQVEESN